MKYIDETRPISRIKVYSERDDCVYTMEFIYVNNTIVKAPIRKNRSIPTYAAGFSKYVKNAMLEFRKESVGGIYSPLSIDNFISRLVYDFSYYRNESMSEPYMIIEYKSGASDLVRAEYDDTTTLAPENKECETCGYCNIQIFDFVDSLVYFVIYMFDLNSRKIDQSKTILVKSIHEAKDVSGDRLINYVLSGDIKAYSKTLLFQGLWRKVEKKVRKDLKINNDSTSYIPTIDDEVTFIKECLKRVNLSKKSKGRSGKLTISYGKIIPEKDINLD